MSNFIANMFSNGAGNVVDAVSDLIDNAFTSEEEKKELDLELKKAEMKFGVDMAEIGLKTQALSIQDTNSARENQSRVQESEHASWLARNVQPVLAIAIIALTFLIFGFVITGGLVTDQNKDIVIYVLGALTTVATQVVSYFFGSSKGSQDKQFSLDKLNRG